MSPIPFLAAAALALLMMIAPAQSVEELQSGFMAKYDALNAERDQKLETLEAGYKTALKRLLEDIQKSGKLETVLLVRDELTAIETGKDPLPDLPPNTPDRLRPLRAKFVDQHAKILRDHLRELGTLSEKMQALLAEKEISLTKEGKIDDALAIQRIKQSLLDDPGIQAARASIKTQAPAASTWISLSKAEMEVLVQGQHFVGWRKDSKGASILPSVEENILKYSPNKEPVLISVPEATVHFKFPTPVAKFRSRIVLAKADGDAEFSVVVNGKIIKKMALSGDVGTKDFECSFPATREIELKTGANGSVDNDWVAWINPEAS